MSNGVDVVYLPPQLHTFQLIVAPQQHVQHPQPHPQHGVRPQLGPPLPRRQQHILVFFRLLDLKICLVFLFFFSFTRFADVLFQRSSTNIYTRCFLEKLAKKRNFWKLSLAKECWIVIFSFSSKMFLIFITSILKSV